MRRSVVEPVVLSDDERETLERRARRPKCAQALALRCRIILERAEGGHNIEVAERLGIGRAAVNNWRARFQAQRLAGLHDEPRPGAPRTISDDDVEALIVKTLEEPPDDATRCSTRSMAKATGNESVGGVADLAGLWAEAPPGRHVKLSPDPLFVEKVRDIVGLYVKPPDASLGCASTRKTQVQALDRTAQVLPLRPGLPERRTHDFVRHGTTNLYAALDVASGHVITDMTDRHRAAEFRRFLNLINRSVPEGFDIHLIVDNVSTHKTPEIKRWLLRHPRFMLHFTLTYSSWINLIERWFAELTTKWLRRGTHSPTKELEAAITEWVDHWNENSKPFVWHKSADEILDTLSAYCARISASYH